MAWFKKHKNKIIYFTATPYFGFVMLCDLNCELWKLFFIIFTQRQCEESKTKIRSKGGQK